MWCMGFQVTLVVELTNAGSEEGGISAKLDSASSNPLEVGWREYHLMKLKMGLRDGLKFF